MIHTTRTHFDLWVLNGPGASTRDITNGHRNDGDRVLIGARVSRIFAIKTNIQGVPKISVNKEISITFELMNIVQGLHMFRQTRVNTWGTHGHAILLTIVQKCSAPKNTTKLTPHTPLNGHLFKSYANFLIHTFFWDTLYLWWIYCSVTIIMILPWDYTTRTHFDLWVLNRFDWRK